MPFVGVQDELGARYAILSGELKNSIRNLTIPPDDMGAHWVIDYGAIRQFYFSDYEIPPDDLGADYTIVSGDLKYQIIFYDYWEDDLMAYGYTIESGELT